MIRKSIKEQIKEHFFLYPKEKLRVRQLERKLTLPLPSVIRYTQELVTEGILQKQVIDSAVLFTANNNAKRYQLEKRLYNLKSLYDSGLIDYFNKNYKNPVMILFGSYLYGCDDEDSDIDIYVELPEKTIILPKIFEKRLRRTFHFFIHKNIREVGSPYLMNNIVAGFLLNGDFEAYEYKPDELDRMSVTELHKILQERHQTTNFSS